MIVFVNGEEKSIEKDLCLAQALLVWGYAQDNVAIAHNGVFAPKANYASIILAASDYIDVVTAVEGG